MSKITCYSCGKESGLLSSGERPKFCGNCGHSLSLSQIDSPTQAQNEIKVNIIKNTKPKLSLSDVEISVDAPEARNLGQVAAEVAQAGVKPAAAIPRQGESSEKSMEQIRKASEFRPNEIGE